MLPADVGLQRFIPQRVQFCLALVHGHLDVLDQAALQELVGRQYGFADETILAEGFAEHARGVVGQFPRHIRTAIAQRGGCPHANQLPPRSLPPLLHPPDEAGQVRAMRTVEGVHLVHNQLAQGFRAVVPPQWKVGRTHQLFAPSDVFPNGVNVDNRLRLALLFSKTASPSGRQARNKIHGLWSTGGAKSEHRKGPIQSSEITESPNEKERPVGHESQGR